QASMRMMPKPRRCTRARISRTRLAYRFGRRGCKSLEIGSEEIGQTPGRGIVVGRILPGGSRLQQWRRNARARGWNLDSENRIRGERDTVQLTTQNSAHHAAGMGQID